MKLIRKCPRCQKIITYKYDLTYNRAIKNDTLCRTCAPTVAYLNMSPEMKEKNKLLNVGRKQSEESNKKKK